MTRPSPHPAAEPGVRAYRVLLRLLPRALVVEHGRDMERLFADHLAATRSSRRARYRLWVAAVADVARHALHFHRRARRRPGAGFPGQLPRDRTMSQRLRSAVITLGRDAGYGLRLLRNDWSFTLTVTLILGLAIGANTAIFSFVDTYLLRPLPYPEAERLASVTRVFEGGGEGLSVDGRVWEVVRDAAPGRFDAAVYSGGASGVNLATGDTAVNVTQQRVGAGFFDVLGVQPQLGREFTAQEDVPDGPAVTILSHGLWQRTFNGDPGALGNTLLLRGEPYTVVGVMPEDFRASTEADLWVPLRPNTTGEGGGSNYGLLVRLHENTTWAEAETTLAAVGQALQETDYQGGIFDLGLAPLQRTQTQQLRRPLQVLWISVFAVLLVACVNVSGLLLVRGSRRGREIATRMALGGARAAVTRQLLVESLVLAIVGGVFGVILAHGMLWGLEQLGRGVLDTWRPVTLDARVLAGTGVVSFLTALLVGLAPAVQAGSMSIHDALRSGGSRGATGGMKLGRRMLVITEVGLSVVLLVMAGLLLRTFMHFQTLDPGFEPEGVVTFSVSLQDARYESAAEVEQLFEEGLRRVRAMPGTLGATASLGVPYERQLNMGFQPLDFELDPDTNTITNLLYVSPDYFETLGVPVIEGRAIDASDGRESAPVVMVNRAFADRFMPDTPPVGRGLATVNAERRIIGVVGNVKHAAGWGSFDPVDDIPTLYIPLSQVNDGFVTLVHGWFSPAWIVRVAGDPRDMARELEQTLAAVDPLLPIASTRLASQVLGDAIAGQRFVAVLVGLLAASSVILASLGIWGLVAASVVEQRRDIGIRLALGATRSDAISVVAMPSIKLAAVGAVLGIGGSLLAGRAVASMLWGVTPSDPVTYGGVAVTLLIAACVASLLPATRAARLDPARTLQSD